MSVKSLNAAFIAAFLAGAIASAAAQSRPNATSKASTSAAAESGTSVPNALQGFQQNRGQPVKIQAASLEVRDKDKVATFSGDVVVTQGDTVMRCQLLVVFYDADTGNEAQAGAKAGHAGA